MPELGMDQFTNVFRASEPRKVRRNRQALSCTACQKRKSRCDRRQPCNACEKRGDEGNCRFGPIPAGCSMSGSRTEVQNRLTKLEELVRNLAQQQPKPGQGPQPGGLPVENNKGLAPQVHAQEYGCFPSYHGPTSWSALVDNIRDIQNALDAEEDIDGPEQVALHEPDAIFGDLPAVTTEDILKSLPPRQDVDKLVAAYFNSNYLAIPFIHTHQFKRCYERFWENPEASNPLWVSIMFSILSAGAMVAKAREVSMSSPTAAANPRAYMTMSSRCLVSGQYLKARALSVEAVVMHVHSRNVQKADGDATLWTLYGVAVRLAQRQGYHRDPKKVSSSITPFQAEMRRRVWFVVSSYDLMLSYQQGMPPMTHEDVTDAGDPLNIPDDDFDEGSTSLTPRPPNDPFPILAYVTKSRLVPTFRRIMRHALGVKPDTFEVTSKLGRELDQWYDTIPPCLRYRSVRETAFTDQNHTIMHRIMLEMLYHMARCVLYRSFLLDKDDKIVRRQTLDICGDSALKVVRVHMEVDREVQPGGRLHEDRYMVSSLTLHGFLSAAIIICLELTDCPDMCPEDKASRIDILKTAQQMWAARSKTSSDALHASKVLRAILNRVQNPNWSSSATLSKGSHSMRPSTPDVVTPHNQISNKDYAPGGFDVMMSNGLVDQCTLELGELLPLESFFTETEGLDWNSIDQYIRPDPLSGMVTVEPLPDVAL